MSPQFLLWDTVASWSREYRKSDRHAWGPGSSDLGLLNLNYLGNIQLEIADKQLTV